MKTRQQLLIKVVEEYNETLKRFVKVAYYVR